MSRPRYLRAILVYSCIKEGLLYYGDVESILNVLGCMEGPVIFGRISIGHVSWLTALTTTYLTTLTNYLSSKLQLVPPELSLLTAHWCIRDDYKGTQRWTMPENRYFLGYYDLRYVVSKEQDKWWHTANTYSRMTVEWQRNDSRMTANYVISLLRVYRFSTCPTWGKLH